MPLGRTTLALATVLLTTTLFAPAAVADDTAPPVVGADTVALYPGQTRQLDVLANDSSPSGDDLALCRFPEVDYEGSYLHSVVAMSLQQAIGYGGAGELVVMTGPRVRGTYEVEYYVCDTHHLVPATLTVVIRDAEPVDVTTIPGRPGRISVTNNNDHPIRFWFGHPRASRPDGRLRVDAGATEIVRVQRHRILWVALIGSAGSKGDFYSSPGIADFGRLGGIELRGEPLPGPHHPPLQVSPGTPKDLPHATLGRWTATR